MRATLRALALLLLLPPAPARGDWVRVESPHFIVFGEVGATRTREFAAEFERFREALGRVVPGAAVRPATPAVVFIFKDAKSFEPFRPLYNGKPVAVGGYFAGGPSLDVIMLPATNREAALHTIYHEYSHLITLNLARDLPIWLGEGLAEYYSTFEFRPGDRRAVLGGIIPAHLVRLNQEPLLPLEQLVSVMRDSPLYNEGSRRSTFYAQSWALVHMLLNGEQDRTAQFNAYIRLTAAGRPPLDAWREVFGREKILEQLQRYVRQARMKAYLYAFNPQAAPVSYDVSVPTPGEIHAALGDLRLHVAPETAAAHMERTPLPRSPYANAILGHIKLAEGKEAEALPLLLDAANAAEDWLVQYRVAVGLERLATGRASPSRREAARAAEAALARVLARQPDLPHAVALRGMVEGPGDAGLARITRARQLAPGRLHYAIWQAQFHSARGEFREARELLAPLMSPSFPQEIRDYARTVMGAAVTAEQARTQLALTGPRAPARSAPRPTGIVVPLYREPGAGEFRFEAILERLECPRERVILHVRIAGQPAQFIAADLDAVEFLTQMGATTAPVACGLRKPPDRIYLTWRPAADHPAFAGAAVAVEFLAR